MPRVRVWALESNYDATAVECLANKLVTHSGLNGVSIQSSGRSAIPRRRKSATSSGDHLKTAVLNYLQDDDFLVFVIDTDSPMSSHQRLQEPNSLINQILRVLKDRNLKERVFLSKAVHELESWLLVDCLGIFCYFAVDRKHFRSGCREKIAKNRTYFNIVNKHQKGDTELIVEPERGRSGPKEYLQKYSEGILRGLNPTIPPKNVRSKRYREEMLPKIAEHVVINHESLRRNESLRKLGHLLSRFENSSFR